MFRDSIAGHLARTIARPPLVLVLGSTDNMIRSRADSTEAVTRRRGGLHLHESNQRLCYERAMRESGRDLVGRLSEAGISSVFFFGADRSLIGIGENDEITVSGFDTMRSLSESGVVAVLAGSALDNAGELYDVHPIHVCKAIHSLLATNDSKCMSHIVIPVSRLPRQWLDYADAAGEFATEDLDQNMLDLDEEIREFVANPDRPFRISDVSRIGGVSQIRVGV